MKHAIALATLIAIGSIANAGSIKMPASANITRNAGQSIPVAFTASGWPAGQVAQVWLLNAQTWQGQLVWIDQPIQNGFNQLSLQIPWNWDQPGRYLVKVVCGNTQATSTGIVTIRTAIKYPWGGTQWWPGAATAVTWVTDGISFDYLEISLESETDDLLGAEILNDTDNPEPLAGRYEFNVPALPPGTYRLYLYGYAAVYEWDEFSNDLFYYNEIVAQTRSEKITIR
jgi:hypothetical protein